MLSRSLSMQPDSFYWQWLAWNWRASLMFLLHWLTIWPLAGFWFKHPLHASHRLLYRRLWKINEGGKVNKGGFRRSSFTSIHLFSNSLSECWGMPQPQSLSDWILVMYFTCLGLSFLLPDIFSSCSLAKSSRWLVKVKYSYLLGFARFIHYNVKLTLDN